MYLIGALVVVGPREVAIVGGATTAVLLHLREELHTWVDRLSDRDVRAIMQFVLISLVILPILPDETLGPYAVVNPRQVWWMVVLIVGLNLMGYAAFRLMGATAGTALAGVLGGVISSTATTASYARQTRDQVGKDATAVVVVWIASGIVFLRVLLEISAVSPALLSTAAGPIGVMLTVFILVTGLVWRTAKASSPTPLEPTNPTELKTAILFGALYAVVLLVVAAGQDLMGDVGLYAAAAVSGLTDVDAITLSTARLVSTERLSPDIGWRLVMIAVLSNLVFKLGLAGALGSKAFARRLGGMGAFAIATGVLLLIFWR
jgi:uncharacterized membrane protein (DUF4010 family)